MTSSCPWASIAGFADVLASFAIAIALAARHERRRGRGELLPATPRTLARENVAANRTITTSIALLGFLIVAISMVGLANAITTIVLECTREIGILRCIGARARDVRRIFTTAGIALALAGWSLGVPLGYALNRLLVWLVREVVDVRVPVVFPPWNLALALGGTVALSLLITLLPIRRAVRFRPGDALRHA